jgi:zinc transport system ATP-binding protein
VTAAAEPLIELVDVDLAYGEVLALEAVTLTVARGDFLGLIGPNGSGKTTLLRVLLGLATPDRGEVRLFGQPPSEFREWRRLGYVPQRLAIDATLPATVDEVVRSGLLGVGPRWRRETGRRARVDEVLGRVGMAAQRRARIGALSVGQQQRVLIARALVSEPELLVLDEPTSGVDPEAQTSFYGLLHDLNRANGVTLILVSHDIGVVAKEVTRLACLNRRLVFHGRPADFLGDDAALAALYGPAVRVVTHDHA